MYVVSTDEVYVVDDEHRNHNDNGTDDAAADDIDIHIEEENVFRPPLTSTAARQLLLSHRSV